jgi:hypothetical protein
MSNVVKLEVVHVEPRVRWRYNMRPWTAEQEQRYQDARRPNPAHVAHLRAGIQEFRALLEARSNR